MSSVLKVAKVARYVFAALVAGFVLFAISAYMKAEEISKGYIQDVASRTLGVSVFLGDMEISVEKKSLVLKDIKIGNPAGYRGPYAATAERVEVRVDSFERERVTFNLASVKGLQVFLEMNTGSTNLHDLQQQAGQNARNSKPDGKFDELRVMIRSITYEKPVLRPVSTLEPTNIGALTANDLFVRDIGTAENGLSLPHVIARIVRESVAPMHLMANEAELFKGMTLETLNSLGVSTYDVFKKNVNKKINKDMNDAQKLFNNLYQDVSKGISDMTAPEPEDEGGATEEGEVEAEEGGEGP